MAYYNPYLGNYNNNYNNNYNPNYNPNFNYQSNQTIQNGGFVTVQSEEEARSYPVGHGTSVTFRDENSPYIYTKTLGFGQFDSPIFEKYKLIKENAQKPEIGGLSEKVDDLPSYVTKEEFDVLRGEMDALKAQIGELRKELGDESI